MKYFPQLELSDASRDFQEEFLGYNHNLRISDNEFYNMKNMSGDYYPVLSPRDKRGIVKQLDGCTGVICKNALCYIDKYGENGSKLYINDFEITPFTSTTTAQTYSAGINYTHVMVSMGAYLIIFRKSKEYGLTDGWFYNTAKSAQSITEEDYGYIDHTNEFNHLEITTCGYNGSEYSFRYIGSSAPTGEVNNGDKWLDTSSKPHVVKVWSESQQMWTGISTTYVKLTAPGIASGFKVGDAVKISDLSEGYSNIYATGTNAPITITEDIIEQLKTLSTNTIIQSVDESETNGIKNNGWIVVVGIIDASLTIQYSGDNKKVSREAPYMDFICEHNNRLWGCRYGLNRNDDTVNEIYASKQGDFRNWNCYAGISTDSYAVSVGSEDVWTGCTPFGNSVLFFKENVIHKIYGSIPADFQTTEQRVRGIQRGSEKSLCFVNETLFYKSTTDVCYYDGSTPVGVSGALGDVAYSNAVFGSTRNKLYANMLDENGEWNLFVFNVASQMWHREDDIHCKYICRVDDDVYFVDENNVLGTFTGAGTPESDFEWYSETGVIGYSLPDNKYIGRMSVRLKKPVNSDVRLFIQYDNSSKWNPVATLNGESITSISIPILPKRCDHFRLRFEGKGECKIFSISKTIELGSDV